MTQFPFLPSIEISGFRAFSSLRIQQLGKINLIIGKNNVGKSSLLEALRLYASNGSLSVASQILDSRDEGRLTKRPRRTDLGLVQALPKLFHRDKGSGGIGKTISIGPIGEESQQLRIELGMYVRGEEDGRRVYKLASSSEAESTEGLLPGLSVRRNGFVELHMLTSDINRRYYPEDEEETAIYHYVAADGLTGSQIGALWDAVSLSETENDVIASLKIILPELDRVVMVGDSEEARNRIPIARLSGSEERIPLRTLGEGMNRLFGLTLALVNSASGLLLVDEIESGLHYSVQSEVWRLIFEVSKRLNIQVFATTHSKDCIDAFEKAAADESEVEGLVIRLQSKGEQISIFEFEERELSIARKNEIEIR